MGFPQKRPGAEKPYLFAVSPDPGPKYLKAGGNGWFKQRLIGVMLVVIAAFSVLILRLAQLQLVQGEEFRRLSENNCIRLQSLDAPRGLIYDRHGRLLVDNRPSFDLYITRKNARPQGPILERLSRILGVTVPELEKKVNNRRHPSYKPMLLQSDIGRDALAAVEARKFELPGVSLRVRSVRQYLQESAAHLIGYLGEINARELKRKQTEGADYRPGDPIGKSGVEKTFEDILRGRQGGRQVEVNAAGQVVRVLHTVEPDPGHDLYLTLDIRLQKRAERLLAGVAGAAVAVSPESGQVLAAASSPDFDPNEFVGGLSHKRWQSLLAHPFRPMENKVIQGEYPPASTYKIVTAMAGLEEGVISPSTSFYCPGYHRYGNRIYRCWKRGGHGRVSVVRALAGSCDVFFYQVGQRLGVDRLARYAKACGLGAPTGIALDHEADGLIPTADWKRRRLGTAWQGGETLSVAIGQGYNLVTPLQMAMLTAAVANGGVWRAPLLVRRIETADNQPVGLPRPQATKRLPVSQETLDLVKKGLFEVVHGSRGTARVARIAGLRLSGKTGTGQVVGRQTQITRHFKPDYLKAHAWFVAYAPAQNPVIAVAVLVEHGEHGSGTAAPIAREIIKTYMEGEDRRNHAF